MWWLSVAITENIVLKCINISNINWVNEHGRLSSLQESGRTVNDLEQREEEGFFSVELINSRWPQSAMQVLIRYFQALTLEIGYLCGCVGVECDVYAHVFYTHYKFKREEMMRCSWRNFWWGTLELSVKFRSSFLNSSKIYVLKYLPFNSLSHFKDLCYLVLLRNCLFYFSNIFKTPIKPITMQHNETLFITPSKREKP